MAYPTEDFLQGIQVPPPQPIPSSIEIPVSNITHAINELMDQIRENDKTFMQIRDKLHPVLANIPVTEPNPEGQDVASCEMIGVLREATEHVKRTNELMQVTLKEIQL